VDKRGLAPLGWHIPSRNEWFKLFEHFGGDSLAGPELKNKVLWYSNGNDRSEMNILPAGGRNMYGVFHFGIGGSVAFWTSTEFNSEMAYCIYFGDKDKVTNSTTEKSHGYYLRCIKD
jgi:uncharacterized protein (TIGR02145 family)